MRTSDYTVAGQAYPSAFPRPAAEQVKPVRSTLNTEDDYTVHRLKTWLLDHAASLCTACQREIASGTILCPSCAHDLLKPI